MNGEVSENEVRNNMSIGQKNIKKKTNLLLGWTINNNIIDNEKKNYLKSLESIATRKFKKIDIELEI